MVSIDISKAIKIGNSEYLRACSSFQHLTIDAVTSILRYVSAYNDVETLHRLLDRGIDLDIRNKHGQTILIIAAKDECIDAMRMILEYGADIDARDNDGWTVLMHAVTSENIEMVKMLLEFGANLNIQDKCGWTTLVHAMFNNYNHRQSKDILLSLLDSGAGTSVLQYYSWMNNDTDYNVPLSIVGIYPRCIYQNRDRSREYMSLTYSDLMILRNE